MTATTIPAVPVRVRIVYIFTPPVTGKAAIARVKVAALDDLGRHTPAIHRGCPSGCRKLLSLGGVLRLDGVLDHDGL